MTDRPIIFSGPMVKALLEGRKTQTRRILNPQPYSFNHPENGQRTWNASGQVGGRICRSDRELLDLHRKPSPGDRLYVRENIKGEHTAYDSSFSYEATGDQVRWRNRADADWLESYPRPLIPSIHMPRWASRLTLTVTEVRIERLNDISEADARAEGVSGNASGAWGSEGLIEDFADLWNSIHGPDAWDANPWVCAVSFTVEKANIDRGAV